MQTDRSLRSVFVGNIPYDATEEKLRDIFSAVGPVLSFRIVFDRETGKPKGYGFCEYKDQETATSAIRNLNGHDLGGRQLRVDSASNERARDEPDNSANSNDAQSHQQQIPNPLQQMLPVTEPLIDAQTVIHNVMCSLPPEQLFDLCKQFKTSLLVNPNDTRQLLMHNPQLSYAIIQSLVMIKAIDAQTALETFHQQLMQPNQIQPTMPMMAPIGPPLSGPAAPGGPPIVVPPQPMTAPSISGQPSMVIQPQVMNPFSYMVPASAGGTQPQPPMPAPMPAVSLAPIPSAATTTCSAAPADPRLARQQQQPSQQPQQSQPQAMGGISDRETQSFIMQVMRMSDMEISMLPPDQRDKVYDIRRQYSLTP